MTITAERARELLQYDPSSGHFRWRMRRGHVKAGALAGNLGTNGYIDIRVDRRLYRGHRIAWLYMTGEWPTHQVDHKNSVRNDNRWENLRLATNAQNQQNLRKARADNSSGFLGVFPNKNRWSAQIAINGKSKCLGTFDTPELAHAAYLKAKASIHEFQTLVVVK